MLSTQIQIRRSGVVLAPVHSNVQRFILTLTHSFVPTPIVTSVKCCVINNITSMKVIWF